MLCITSTCFCAPFLSVRHPTGTQRESRGYRKDCRGDASIDSLGRMIASRAKLQDVAKAAGVHMSTASRALNPATRHMITPEAAGRVERAARELGYSVNALASGLRRRRSHAIGVVIPDLLNAVFPPIIVGIERALRDSGYGLTIASDGNDPGRHAGVLETMLARQVDGLIMATATLDDPAVEDLVRRGVIVVMVNRRDRRSRASSVVTDDQRGIALAVDHLVSLGHKRISHLAGPQMLSTGSARQRGFVEAMAGHGLPADGTSIRIAETFGRGAGKVAAAALLARSERPTAIVAANDLLAMGCYDALRDLGLGCPRDVSVTGYNDMPLVDLVSPPLTTVRIQHHQMGAEAARLLLRKLEDATAPDVDLVLHADLVIRGSSGRPRASPRRRDG